MSNQGAKRRAGVASIPPVAWPVWSGSPPGVTDFFSPRPETGYGLDAGQPEVMERSAGDQHALTVLVGPSGYGKTYLAQRELRLEDCDRPAHDLLFHVGGRATAPASAIEVRVWTSGIVPLTVSSISVELVGLPSTRLSR